MKYIGQLYGKVAGKYCPLDTHSDYVGKLEEAAKLALELLVRAAKDAGDGTDTGCPFVCHNEDCETCLPQRAERALRAALAQGGARDEAQGEGKRS